MTWTVGIPLPLFFLGDLLFISSQISHQKLTIKITGLITCLIKKWILNTGHIPQTLLTH